MQYAEAKWKWVRYRAGADVEVGVFKDGTLYNPNNYDEAVIREAVRQAEEDQRQSEERWRIRRSEAAKRAAVTRRRRQERKILEIAKGLVAKRQYGPREHCVICGKYLSDNASIARGIGSECWQHVLDWISQHVEPGQADLFQESREQRGQQQCTQK